MTCPFVQVYPPSVTLPKPRTSPGAKRVSARNLPIGNNIRVIAQGASAKATPVFYTNTRLAAVLLQNEECKWLTGHEGEILEQLPKTGRLEDDSKIKSNGAIRGLSAEIGAPLALALSNPKTRGWAQPMYSAIRLRRERPSSTRLTEVTTCD